MDKHIKIIMKKNEDIDVMLNDNLEFTIVADNRVLEADKIYNMLGYESGDIYTINKENESPYGERVLDMFYSLFENIILKLNDIESVDEQIENIQINDGLNNIIKDIT